MKSIGQMLEEMDKAEIGLFMEIPSSLGHKIRLNPTKEQAQEFVKAAGCARHAYNWGLAMWQEEYAAWKRGERDKKPTAYGIQKLYAKAKKEEFLWAYESPKDAGQRAIINLGEAYSKFFRGEAEYPKPKKKGKCPDKFYTSNDRLEVDNYRVWIPKIGWVEMRELLRFQGKILGAVISRDVDQWYISFQVELPKEYKRELEPEELETGIPFAVFRGVDLGLKHTIVTSDGQVFDAPKPLKEHMDELRLLSRSLSRKLNARKPTKLEDGTIVDPLVSPDSEDRRCNIKKTVKEIQKLYRKIRRIRLDWIHKVTKELASKTKVIVLETLAVSNMMKNRKLARSISDVGWGEIRRQVTYKAPLYGNVVITAPRFFPSSKTCSSCRHVKKELLLSEREYVCYSCGVIEDRDINAAKNLEALGNCALNYIGSNCGQKSSGKDLEIETCETILEILRSFRRQKQEDTRRTHKNSRLSLHIAYSSSRGLYSRTTTN